MPATRVVDVLAEVFRTFGFDTTTDAHPEGMSRTPYELPLLAEKGGMDVAVAIHEGDTVDMDLVEEHARMVRDIGAYYGLLVTTGTTTEAACEAAARQKLILWDRRSVEAVIGKAVLTEVRGHEATELPIAEVLSYGRAIPDVREDTHAPMQESRDAPELPDVDAAFDLLEPTAIPQVVSATPATPDPGVVEGRGWYLTTGSRNQTPETPRPGHPLHSPPARENSWTAPVTDPDPVYKAPPKPSLAQIAAMGGTSRMPRASGLDPRTFNPTEGALLAPTISKERAAALARERIYTIDNTRLRYHPKRVYQWSVECFVEGSVQTRTMTGTRLVDLATRAVESPPEWTPSRSLREGTFDVPVDHKPVRLEAERARTLAVDNILEETVREIVVEDHDPGSDVMMTQKKRVRAHRDDVRLQDEGLHWCPIWCFTGVNGEVEVDAMSGTILGETLHNRTGNTMVL